MNTTSRSFLARFLVLTILIGYFVAACGPALTPTEIPGEPGGADDSGVVHAGLPRQVAPEVPDADLRALSSGNSAFAFAMYQALRGQDGNLFYSPYSISMALAMTYAGARGETERQIAETLRFDLDQGRLHPAFNALVQTLESRALSPDEEEAGFELSLANAIWGQDGYTFLDDFLVVLAENYGAGLRLLDFIAATEQARQTINAWVSDETQGRIEDLIPPGVLNDMTRLVLTNAIYFKANWLAPFDINLTGEEDFHLPDGEVVQVPMMRLSRPKSFPYMTGDGYQAVELPYSGVPLGMVILVPDEGRFDEFEERLDAQFVADILAGLQPAVVALEMPAFTYETSLQLADLLAEMGMEDAFDPNRADLSGMDGTQQLYIKEVIHKAFVAVDERGTEAAAATAVIVEVTSLILPDVELSIDRPFIFLIRDEPTGAILFVGRVLNPAE